jgi:Fe-S-cluster-containing dehydrogenase component
VQTCIGRSRVFGDINDPNSEVSYLIAKNPTQVLRPEQGTKPHVFYIGADRSQTEFGRDAYKPIELMEQQRSAFKTHFEI